MAVEFKPYYVIQAYSNRTRKLLEEHLMTEMELSKRCMKKDVARHRAINFAASLNELEKHGATDWQPRLQLVSDKGKYPVQV